MAEPRKPLWKRLAWVAFALLVAWMLWRLGTRTDWPAVLASARTRSPWQLATIALLALAGHAVYGLLDGVGRGLAGHRLPLWRTWLRATTCYAMNLNLGDAAGYGHALAALLIGAVAAAVTHVPGGLGVLDFVVVTMLAGIAARPELVAAVLLYRAAYYLLPLALAAPAYLLLTRTAAGGLSRDAGARSRRST